MYPRLIDLGVWRVPVVGDVELFLPTYGVLFALSALAAWWWFSRGARRLGISDEATFNLSFYTLLAGILGAKLTLVLLDLRYYLAEPRELVGTVRSAGVLMGGVAAGAVVFAAYGRQRRLPVLRLADAIAAPLALAQSVGRLGCFGAGCCYGVPARPGNRFAVVFTDPAAAERTGVPLNVPLVPTQLTQMASDLVLALVLTWLWRRRSEPPGTVFWWYMLLYGLSRGLVEFWRGDAGRGLYFGQSLSTSQILSAAAVVVALVMLLRGRPRQGQVIPA